MVEHRAVCEVDCFAALAKTGWGSQRRDGVRNDGVGFAMMEWGSQRRATVSARSEATRQSIKTRLCEAFRPWQSMVEHRAVCEVDCFAALAKTGWGSQRRDGVRNDGVGFAMMEWRSQ